MLHSNYTTTEDKIVFIHPLEKLQEDWTTCDVKQDGAEAPTRLWGKWVLPPSPCRVEVSAALYTAEPSAVSWGLHHWGHPPHISCDARVPPGAGCWAWGLQRCLLQPPLPPSKYHPGKQNHSKRQQPTSCSRSCYMSILCSRRTLGTICPSQLQHFPGSHPVLTSAKARKPSISCRGWFIWATAYT